MGRYERPTTWRRRLTIERRTHVMDTRSALPTFETLVICLPGRARMIEGTPRGAVLSQPGWSGDMAHTRSDPGSNPG